MNAPILKIQISGSEKDLFDDVVPCAFVNLIHADDFELFITIINKMVLKSLQKPPSMVGTAMSWCTGSITHELFDDSNIYDSHTIDTREMHQNIIDHSVKKYSKEFAENLQTIRDAVHEFVEHENEERWCKKGLCWSFAPIEMSNPDEYGAYGLFLTFTRPRKTSHIELHPQYIISSEALEIE